MAIGRRERVLAMINSKGLVSLKELEHVFPEVSSMTLRRDLQFLADRGEVVRMRRGARSINMHVTGEQEPVYAMRAVASLEAKEAIAQVALPMIEQGRTIFLDAGSTCMQIARRLPDLNSTFLTHGANIALELSKFRAPDVFLLGGKILKDSLASTGHDALSMLEQFNIDLAFLSPAGFVPGVGFTCGDLEECELKRQVVHRARRTVIVLDQSKIDAGLPMTFAKPEDIQTLIINGPIEGPAVKDALAELERANVQILYADLKP